MSVKGDNRRCHVRVRVVFAQQRLTLLPVFSSNSNRFDNSQIRGIRLSGPEGLECQRQVLYIFVQYALISTIR